MAKNITEKDRTLQEVIDWCEQLEVEGLRLANALLMQRDMAAYGVVKGQINAYEKTADHCRSMLGHSVPMYSLEQLEHERRKATRPDGKTRNATSRHTQAKTHTKRPSNETQPV